jgi:hypothetical protein
MRKQQNMKTRPGFAGKNAKTLTSRVIMNVQAAD